MTFFLDVVAYGLLYVMKWISSSEVVLILVSIPFWTCLFGLFLLDEQLSPYTAMGAFFIVCGIAVYAIFPPAAAPVTIEVTTPVTIEVTVVLDSAATTTTY